MTCFSIIHKALQHSNVSKAVNEVKHHPAKAMAAAKVAMAFA